MAINFPDSPSSGDTFTDATSGFTFQYNGTVWRSFDPSTVANIREIDDISGDFDGSDTTFTLKVAGVNVEPANVQQLIISVGGVMQNAGQDYTVSGSTLTFTTAPTSGLTFFGVLLGTALSLNTIADGSVGRASLSTTTNYLMNGLTLDQGAGILTAFGFKGGSVTADLDSTFAANVSIAGSLTVQGTQTIINTDELNVQDKTIGIGSTNAPTSTTQDDAGVIIYGQTNVNLLYDRDKAGLGINTGASFTGFVTATGGLNINADNKKLEIGASSDLHIYHDSGGNDSFIDNNKNKLYIRNNVDGDDGGDIIIQAKSGEDSIRAIHDAAVELRYNGSRKFQTSGIGVTVEGTMVSTAATVGSGVTINNTGIDAGIGAGIITAKEYYGDATNMTGAGSTFQVLTVSPHQGEEVAAGTPLSQNIIVGFNHAITAGNADKNITLKTDSATGTTIQTFDVDSDVTYSFSQAILNPTSALELEETYFVVFDEGAVMKTGTATSCPVINGYSFTTADAYRQLYTWGTNLQGVLGQNQSSGYKSSPTQVGTNETWGSRGAIDSGNSADYQFNIKTDGTLWAWGQNQVGALGLNQAHNTNVSSPTQVGTNTNWANIQTGAEGATIAVKTDGTLWSWGQNKSGQSGQNTVGDSTNCFSSPTQVGTDTNWAIHHLGCLYEGCAALKTDGTLWMWGSGANGQLGQNTGPGPSASRSSPTQVPGTTWDGISRGKSGTNNTLCTKTDGTLWSWGRGDYGILGLNSNTYYSSPTQVGTDTTWAVVQHCQADENNVAQCTKTDGTLWTWGRADGSGARGINNRDLGSVSSPMQVGSSTLWPTLKTKNFRLSAATVSVGAVKTDGTLWTWGKNGGGQLGLNEGFPGGDRSSPTQVGTQTDWDSIFISGYNSNSAHQTAQAVTKNATPG